MLTTDGTSNYNQ